MVAIPYKIAIRDFTQSKALNIPLGHGDGEAFHSDELELIEIKYTETWAAPPNMLK